MTNPSGSVLGGRPNLRSRRAAHRGLIANVRGPRPRHAEQRRQSRRSGRTGREQDPRRPPRRIAGQPEAPHQLTRCRHGPVVLPRRRDRDPDRQRKFRGLQDRAGQRGELAPARPAFPHPPRRTPAAVGAATHAVGRPQEVARLASAVRTRRRGTGPPYPLTQQIGDCGVLRLGQLLPRGGSGKASSGLSSSSMLTSLNVTTRTVFTNRAGRYMSHTQASRMVSSK